MSAPVYPDHDGEAGLPRQTTRASNIQVETLKFDLLQVLYRRLGARESQQFFLNGFAFRLWTNGSTCMDERLV
jgi:hypothetical protein